MKLISTFCFLFIGIATSFANNILVQNVTTTGNNATNKTIQVQFDLSWDNSWRDAINWDASWVFMKFKDANGVWQHAKLNQTGFNNGSGTANTIQVTTDKIGSWIHRSAQGSGTFNSTSIQLQWNYGLSGLNDVAGLEVRVFAVEMVYVPQGDFNCAKEFYNSPNNAVGASTFYAPGQNFPVINSKLTPPLTYNDGSSATVRIKGDIGMDTDNNGTVDNTSYPTGYHAFFCYKYELTEQQYADYLNTLTSAQVTNLGIAGSNITLLNGQYNTSTPNKACGGSNSTRLFSYADWSGVRPMSILEFNKMSYGPNLPQLANFLWSSGGQGCSYSYSLYPAWGLSINGGHNINTLLDVGYYATSSSSKTQSGSSCYGIMEVTGNAHEPVVKLGYFNYTQLNGNGVLLSTGLSDISNWNSTTTIMYIDMIRTTCGVPIHSTTKYGFRYVRSAE